MAVKILKVIWVFSLLTSMAIFMYVYASLPEKVVVSESGDTVSMGKEALFYTVLGIIGLANALVFAVSRIFPQRDEHFKAWFYGLVSCVNLFFLVALSFVSLYNSGEKYDFGRLGVIIYGSVALVVAWALAWPVYRFSQRLANKQPV